MHILSQLAEALIHTEDKHIQNVSNASAYSLIPSVDGKHTQDYHIQNVSNASTYDASAKARKLLLQLLQSSPLWYGAQGQPSGRVLLGQKDVPEQVQLEDGGSTRAAYVFGLLMVAVTVVLIALFMREVRELTSRTKQEEQEDIVDVRQLHRRMGDQMTRTASDRVAVGAQRREQRHVRLGPSVLGRALLRAEVPRGVSDGSRGQGSNYSLGLLNHAGSNYSLGLSSQPGTARNCAALRTRGLKMGDNSYTAATSAPQMRKPPVSESEVKTAPSSPNAGYPGMVSDYSRLMEQPSFEQVKSDREARVWSHFLHLQSGLGGQAPRSSGHDTDRKGSADQEEYAANAIRKILGLLRRPTLDNFADLRERLAQTMDKYLEDTGAQKEYFKAESERVLRSAEQHIERIRQQRGPWDSEDQRAARTYP